jgi:predicted acyltransferase
MLAPDEDNADTSKAARYTTSAIGGRTASLQSASALSTASSSFSGGRLVSLDAFRGFTMFWLLGGKAFVVACAAVSGFELVRSQFTHSDWEGVRYYDLIWPSFMLMVGMAIPFSFARRSLVQTRAAMMRTAWKRALVLFLLGSLRESLSQGQPVLVELSSALQPIALAYLLTSYLAGHSMRVQAGVAAAILAGYALALAWVPAPGITAGTYERNHNLVTYVDLLILGRAHPDGWGTVLSALPAIANTIVGLLLGQVLMSDRTASAKIWIVGVTGAACLASGFVLSPVVPIIMKLWTTSYALVSIGWACLLFLGFYWVTDVKRVRAWAFPLIVIGVNALAAYLLPTIIPLSKIVGTFTKPVAQHLGAAGSVLNTGAVLLTGWLILLWLYRRKIFFRA